MNRHERNEFWREITKDDPLLRWFMTSPWWQFIPMVGIVIGIPCGLLSTLVVVFIKSMIEAGYKGWYL